MKNKQSFEDCHPVVGCLGGGQLGRMMCVAAQDLGIKLIVADPTPNSPAGQFCEQIVGHFNDEETVKKLAEKCNVLTCEIEHVNTDAMVCVQDSVSINPTPTCVRLLQDKYTQKNHLIKNNIPVADYMNVETDIKAIEKVGDKFGYPFMLKSRVDAYDGKGNAVVKSKGDIAGALASLVSKKVYAEKWFSFTKELAVMVVKGVDGTVASYPVVETIQKDNICHTVIAPAQVSDCVRIKAKRMAEQTIATFDSAGIFGVELFVDEKENVVVNEIAPRPHNSGHFTIEACYTSQFENHLRAVIGLPLGDCSMKVGASVMINILGEGFDLEKTWQPFNRALSCPGANIHWYGKSGVKPGRKIGHVTFCGSSMGEVMANITAAGFDLKETISIEDKPPVVSVVMGSDSDLPTMKACATFLRDFGVPFELSIVSAHRTPDRMYNFAKNAHKRGIKIIIAAAGGAAHLPGMIAAITPLPVIGVPIPLRYLDGMDSLYSICQMPRGVPVATVAIGNSTNAALLAVRMLSIGDAGLLKKMEQYQKKIEGEVHVKVDNLDKIGWEDYELPAAK